MQRALLLGTLMGCRAVLGIHDVAEIAEDGGGDGGSADGSAADGFGEVDVRLTDAPGADGAACSSDLKTDRANCGRCGHDCLGGECRDGVCQPVELATNEQGLGAIAVDTASAYWLSGLAVHACALSGCGGVPSTVGSATQAGTAVAVAAGQVVWMTSQVLSRGDVVTCPTSGCGGPPVKLGTGVNNGDPTSLAVDAKNAYWTNSSSTGTVVGCALAGCGGAPSTIASTAYPTAAAVDSANLYWAAGSTTTIYTCPVTGCAGAPRLLLTDAGISRIASNGTYLAWASNAGVFSCTLPACASRTPLATSPIYGRAFAVDDASAYWNDSSGLLMECALAGCGLSPRSLANGQTITALTTDSRAIYWTAFATARVLKLAKP